ncbi:MAG: MaoC family dehydratase N-terminal domain-containing protein [Microthrixaceae bacterium]
MSTDSSAGSSTDSSSDPAVADDVPESVAAMVGKPMYEQTATFPVERSYGYNTLAATQNANPLFWDDDVAAVLTGGITLPPTTLSLWMRPHYWEPGAVGEQVALKVHFDLKETFGLPEAVMTDNTIIFHEPVRPGDVISNRQVLKSVSGPKTTKLGSGRFWVIDVEFHNQIGQLVGVESYTGFGYNRPGVADEAAVTATAAGARSETAEGEAR